MNTMLDDFQMQRLKEATKVKFRVTGIVNNSSLLKENIYEGYYLFNNNSILWKDPQNQEECTLYVGVTCELIDTQEQFLINLFRAVREESKNIGVVTTEIDPQFLESYKRQKSI